MTTRPLNRIHEGLADKIRHSIWSGQLAPGERLREIPLAAKYGVSRGPVRDVFLRLTREGLLQARPNAGVSVAPAPSKFKRRTLVQLRRKLETDALDEVFRRGVDALRDGLTKNLVGYGRACLQEDLEEVVRIDLAFHRLIVESADEGSLVAVWLPVISQMFLRYSRHHSLVESYDEHAAILRAIESGDRQGAKQLLREHIV